MLFIENAEPFLGSLPYWYVQILESREMTCAPCQANWIEVTVTDFDGTPPGESMFLMVAREGTNTALNAQATMLPTNGQSGKIEIPFFGTDLLAEDETDMVVEIGLGLEHLDGYLYSDDHLDEERETVHYLAENPLEYDGPLTFTGGEADMGLQALQIYAEIHTFRDTHRSATAGAATLEMLAELDHALRAALGIYADTSLTARNDAEGRYMLAMQHRPGDAHLRPTAQLVPDQDTYTPVEYYFNGAVTMSTPVQFVGPDGAVYSDPSGMLTRFAHQNPMFEPANTIKEIDALSASVLRELNAPLFAVFRNLKERISNTASQFLEGVENALVGAIRPQPRHILSLVGDINEIAVFNGRPIRLGIGNFGRALCNRARKTQRWIGKPRFQRSGAVNHSQVNAKFLAKTRTSLFLEQGEGDHKVTTYTNSRASKPQWSKWRT